MTQQARLSKATWVSTWRLNRMRSFPDAAIEPPLSIRFLLLPQFTLTAFAGFVDALRLAADEGDRDGLTCTGGTSVVHLAAYLIERHIGCASAVRALRIMIAEQPLPSRTLQPEAVLSVRSKNDLVHNAKMLLIE